MQVNPVAGLVGLITIEPLRSSGAARAADDATLDELFERLASGIDSAVGELDASLAGVIAERPRWPDPLVLVADCSRLSAELELVLARVRRQRRLAS